MTENHAPQPTADLVNALREEFAQRLSRKTGWGRNEVMAEFDQALTMILLREHGLVAVKEEPS